MDDTGEPASAQPLPGAASRIGLRIAFKEPDFLENKFFFLKEIAFKGLVLLAFFFSCFLLF